MFVGKLLCQSAMSAGFNVTFMPSYGAEVRGGTANCHVIIRDKAIASPVVTETDTLIALNEPSLLKFEKCVKKDGLILVNSSLVSNIPKRTDGVLENIPATDLAYDIGNVKTANIIILGRYVAVKKIISKETVLNNIKGPLEDLNKKAFETGYTYIGEKATTRGKYE